MTSTSEETTGRERWPSQSRARVVRALMLGLPTVLDSFRKIWLLYICVIIAAHLFSWTLPLRTKVTESQMCSSCRARSTRLGCRMLAASISRNAGRSNE